MSNIPSTLVAQLPACHSHSDLDLDTVRIPLACELQGVSKWMRTRRSKRSANHKLDTMILLRTRKVAEVASRNRAAVTRHHTQGQCQASKHAVQLVLHASTKAAKNSSLSRGQLRNIITLYMSSPAIAIGRPAVCTATCLEAVSILHSANAFQSNMACDKEAIHRHTPHNITYISLPPRLRNHARASEEDEERR